MKSTLTLEEAVRKLDSLDENGTLCVRRPWTPSAECVLVELDAQLRVPEHVTVAGFDYFLEVHVAREVVEVLDEETTSPDRKVQLLLHYAEFDAYPDWAYER